jgi:hypothetical protein
MPVEIWDEAIDLTLAEFRLLGYLIRHQIRFGRGITSITQDELLNGVWGLGPDGARHRRDSGCGLARNTTVRETLESLQKRGWVELHDISERANIVRWTVRIVLLDGDDSTQHPVMGNPAMSDGSPSTDCRVTQHSVMGPSNTVEEKVEKGVEVHSAKALIRSTIFPYYMTTVRPDDVAIYTLTEKRLKKGALRLMECLKKTKGNWADAEALMKIAIDTLARSDFHMGKLAKTEGRKYNDWDHLFRSAEMLENWFVRSGEDTDAERQNLFH